MKGYVYILKCRNSRYYIGSTQNIERRLKEHRAGKTLSLKYLRPLELVFSQEYSDIKIARKIENKLKRLKSKILIEKIIKETVIILGP